MDGHEDRDLTRDTFFHGKLKVLQPREGYRFSLDAPMLAGFLPSMPGTAALEVGTGCGIISLMGLALERFRSVRTVELQPRLSGLAERNAALNGFQDRMRVIRGDILEMRDRFRDLKLIFSNPPYYPLGRGRLSARADVRDARFETRLTLQGLLEALAVMLAPEGIVCLILPAEREAELLNLGAAIRLYPRRLRRVRSFESDKPGRFLVQLGFHRGDMDLSPPLVIFRSPGEYTREMESLLSGRDHDQQDSGTR